jgi:hypothetical protein
MTLPTNGITADVIRDIMPPYHLDTDLLGAMFAAIPPPPLDATIAWRQARATRLVEELAGLMPANAPQARIAAEIVIVREAAEDSLARAGTAGLAVDQVCRLRRTASALLASVAALERSLVRHQQKPVPFFGTVLADGIDVAALVAGWGGAGVRGQDGVAPAETPCASLDASGRVSTDAPGVEPGRVIAADPGPGDAAASGGDGGSAGGPAPAAMAGSIIGSSAGSSAGRQSPLAVASGRDPAASVIGQQVIGQQVIEQQAASGPARDAGAPFGAVTRLGQGPGWTLDAVRPRKVGEVVGNDLGGGQAATGPALEPAG